MTAQDSGARHEKHILTTAFHASQDEHSSIASAASKDSPLTRVQCADPEHKNH